MSDLESPGSSRLSVTDTKENSDVGVEEEEQLSCCALGQDVSEDSVATSCGVSVQNASLEEVLEEYKTSLRRRFESVTEETDNTGSGTLPNRIYTELYITEGQNEDVHNQHEVMQLEAASKMEALDDITVRCHDTFKALPDQQRPIRVVLTNSVADQRRAVQSSGAAPCFPFQHYRRSQQRSWLSVNFCSSLTAWMKADLDHWISPTGSCCLMSQRSHQSASC
ncbi:uncharacterized protein LOC113026968 [Astatotilapia calliptera]|uniref:uncharacterized protein LOC113026968 n=1 Tax=Astatotilapia calliptera TaxID=8154 RepID=UPI000E41C2C3|nr:uncharacterized protein LOC113026968 [Astatotilapia calliptera]